MQLGFGWGKGRRVIKTTIAGEALTRALARQQRWVDRHPVDEDPAAAQARADSQAMTAALGTCRRARDGRPPRALRMAKADLRR